MADSIDTIRRSELLDALRSFTRARSERGGSGYKKAETLSNRIDALMKKSGYPSEEELRGVVRDVYRYPERYLVDEEKSKLSEIFKQFGELVEPFVYDLTAGDSAEDEPEKKHNMTLEDFDAYLAEKGYQLRYNSITRTYENGGISAADFTADAYSDLVNRYNRVSMDVVDVYAARLSRRNSYNPVVERIEGITWDGVDRLSELCDIIRISASDTLSQTLVKKWCCQCIAMAQNDDKVQIAAQGVLVLQGAQAAGKSTLCRKLAFDDLTLWTDTALKVDDRDSVSRVTSRWISELSELGKVFRANDGDALKNFLTSPRDTFRTPYGKRDESYPRRVNFIATLNPRGTDTRYLTNDGGDRRFWTVLCNLPEGAHFDFERENALNICQLWRQAFEEVNRRGRDAYELTRDELGELLNRNKNFSRPLPAEEELLDICVAAERKTRTGKPEYTLKLITATQAQDEHEQLKRFTVQQIGAALNKLGFESNRRRYYKFWVKVNSPLSISAATQETEV